MGSSITWAKRSCPQRSDAIRFAWGCGIVIVGSVLVGVLGWMIESLSFVLQRNTITQTTWNRLAPWAEIAVVLLHAVTLKCCFGIRSLNRAAISVWECLEKENDSAARQQLAYHLVSRDVEHLSASEISAATIESVSENTSDSVVAPLFFYVIAGLPGALVYRLVNTCDAMLGYRTPQLEWMGKAAARTDDLLNLIPARITAGLMIIASIPSPAVATRAWRTWRQDSRRTASPNAGHPMSAAAGALGVCLEKPDHYRLGSNFRLPDPLDIRNMLSLFTRTVVLAVLLACLTRWLMGTLDLRSTL
jgi:adenosylcobinamide-phosphate synthase